MVRINLSPYDKVKMTHHRGSTAKENNKYKRKSLKSLGVWRRSV